MKAFLLVLAFTVAIVPFAFGQDAAGQDASGKIVGTWKSLDKENGHPLAEVTIKMTAGKLTGAVLLRDLVQNGKNVSLEFPMTDVAFDGKTLTFNLTFSEADKVIVTGWEFLLREDENARFAATKENDAKVEDGPVFVMKRVKAN